LYALPFGKSTKEKGNFIMTNKPHSNYKLKFSNLIVDFPKPEELSIYWATQMKINLSAPYYGWDPTSWDIMDWSLTMHGGLDLLMKSIAEEVVDGLRLVFFLPRQFDLAKHVMDVRSSEDKVTMMNSWQRPPYDPYCPPKMDVLMFKDLVSLATMSERSPYLALLNEVTVGQPQGQAWVYFLALPQRLNDEVSEVEV
jgi:hypothetical protein